MKTAFHIAAVLGIAISSTAISSQKDADAENLDSLIESNIFNAASSEFCSDIKTSRELENATRDVVKIFNEYSAANKSAFRSRSDLFQQKKNAHLEIMHIGGKPSTKSEKHIAECKNIKEGATRALLRTAEMEVHLLKKLKGRLLAKAGNTAADCPLSSDHYLDSHFKTHRTSDLACYKKAVERELK